MPNHPQAHHADSDISHTVASLEKDWTELRSLLLAPEQTQLGELRQRLDHLVIHAKDISRVLPDAVALRGEKDPPLSNALAPYVENGFIAAVRKSPQTIVDAIAPIMGPAIRQAITRALQSMTQSLNRSLDESLSIRGLRWRLEAWRTGRPFAEVVLLHTLRYRVEQVFLIHRKTGLLLHHVATESAAVQDQHLVSGMLTAIQDYVRDSFGATRDEMLDQLQVGEWTVWIEHGSHAYMAAVVRGTPPTSLRQDIRDVLDDFHVHYAPVLERFTGDATPFHATQGHLEACLQAHYDMPPKPGALKFWVLGGVLLLLLTWWGWVTYHAHARWVHLVDQLQAEPGIVVTLAQSTLGGYRLEGLRDPLAKDPTVMIAEAGFDPSVLTAVWSPYYALEPELIVTRAQSILQPPKTVQFHLKDDTLVATGTASAEWARETKRLALMIPGVSGYQDDNLVSLSIAHLMDQINQTIVHFHSGSSTIEPSEFKVLGLVTNTLRQLDHMAAQSGRYVVVELFGFTDKTGSESINLQLSKSRAESVLQALGGEQFGMATRITTISVAQQQGTKAEYSNQRIVMMHTSLIPSGPEQGAVSP